MLTPMSAAGDTAKIANILNIPVPVKWLIAIGGLFFLMLLIAKSGEKFNDFRYVSKENDVSKFPLYILTFPIIIGSVINTLLALPAVVAVSLVYPATSSFAIFAARGKVGKNIKKPDTNSTVSSKINIWLISALIIIIVINRLLVYGYR